MQVVLTIEEYRQLVPRAEVEGLRSKLFSAFGEARTSLSNDFRSLGVRWNDSCVSSINNALSRAEAILNAVKIETKSDL